MHNKGPIFGVKCRFGVKKLCGWGVARGGWRARLFAK